MRRPLENCVRAAMVTPNARTRVTLLPWLGGGPFGTVWTIRLRHVRKGSRVSERNILLVKWGAQAFLLSKFRQWCCQMGRCTIEFSHQRPRSSCRTWILRRRRSRRKLVYKNFTQHRRTFQGACLCLIISSLAMVWAWAPRIESLNNLCYSIGGSAQITLSIW